MNALALRDVSFSYLGTTLPALAHVSLDVPNGQICAIVGRAGAGKSTLCALCAGFIPNFYQGQFSGSALIDGQDAFQQPIADLVRHVGLVGSNPFSQISGARFTVYEEVGFGLENLGVPRAEMIERIDWALRTMQLDELRERSPYELSGGQQQRMVLAATLAMHPPVLVLDEPTGQLDPPATAHLANLLRDLAREGTTILFAEHRLDWVAELAERVVVLDGGQVIADGVPETVFADPLLLDRGVGWPRPALLARRARDAGFWPAARALPLTFEALVQGLRTPVDDEAAPRSADAAVAGDERSATSKGSARKTTGSTAGPPIVQLEQVRFSYPGGVEALRGVSLAVGAGERVALLGRNGAGKSTIVRHLNGLLLPSAGRVLVSGVDTRKTSVARCARQIGIVFQDIRNQLFARTVRDELRFGPRNLGYSPAQVEALVERSLQALGLTAFADEHPYDLPQASRRLIAVAAVLALDSTVLVLDEPTAGLDNAGVARLTALIHDLAAQGKSVIVVSHDLDFCFEALDRVIVVRQGQVVLDSTWGVLDARVLAAEVSLPLSLHVAETLDLPAGSALATLLASPQSPMPVVRQPGER